jgi:signal peptidase I
VGDLILETEVEIKSAKEGEELRFELSKGADRFQARFQLASGECTLVRLTEGREQTLDAPRATTVKGTGPYRIRFANVDERLTLWVNEELPFGDGVIYPPAPLPAPTKNDLQPASIGVKGAGVELRHIQLWRDIYYTTQTGFDRITGDFAPPANALSDPEQWPAEELKKLKPRFFHIHPGHYFCLGDNSPASADSRVWGMVPERLVLGPAVAVYFPFSRAGRVR